MRDGDQEILVRLAYPLPVPLAVELMRAVAKAAEGAGYRDVVILTDGPRAGAIAATPPEVDA